jgi:23S rRNA pseudouridine955/2504/2580 synthase
METRSDPPVNPVKRHPVRHLKVSAEQSGRRIDNFLTSELGDIPKSRIYQMLRRGEVRVDGKRIKQDYRLEQGEEVRIPPVTIDEQDTAVMPPRDYLLDMIRHAVIHEDANLLVLNKPSGLVVHGGSGRSFGVIELLRILRPQQAASLQLVHRLDRETSGVLLISKNLRYLTALQQCFKTGTISKRYIALLKGKLTKAVVDVDQPLERSIRKSGERLSGISPDGKAASTEFRPIRIIKDTTLVDVLIRTGRTHQIRVHSASIGHPVAGDDKYGDREFNRKISRTGLKHLFLHAASVRLPAIEGNKPLQIKAPLPAELEDFVRIYERTAN